MEKLVEKTSYSDKTLLVSEQVRREGCLLPRRFIFLLALVLTLVEVLVVGAVLRYQPNVVGPANQYSGTYRHAAVAADAAECSKIGVEMLKKGGTAVDAGIASLFCVGVMNPQSAGIGGGGFMVYYNATSGESVAIDFREKAPWNITKETMEEYKNNPLSTTKGGLAIGVPGEILGMEYAWKRFGKLKWRDLIQPTIDLASEGVEVSSAIAEAIQSVSGWLDTGKYPGMEELLKPDGVLLKEGDIMKMPALSATLDRIADEGSQYFYNSPFTEQMVNELQAKYGAVLTVRDFNEYALEIRDSLISEYKDLQVIGVPPPASGAVNALVFNILQGYNFTESDYEWLSFHRIVEAYKFSYAQRMMLGDPAFNKTVDQTLDYMMNPDTAREMRSRITDDATHPPPYYEQNLEYSPLGAGTTHLSVLAENGDAVAITSTINTYFGSFVRSSSSGIIFNDEMDDFSVPGRNNSYGFPPSPTNFIEPRKRPQSSTTPTVVTRNGQVVMVLGASGGSRIPTATTQVFLDVMGFGMHLKDAVPAPRLHHQLLPNTLFAERGFPTNMLESLRNVGHDVEFSPTGAVVQAIAVGSNGLIYAASDPRKGGKPSGY